MNVIFIILLMFPLGKRCSHSFQQPGNPGCLCHVWLKVAQWFWKRICHCRLGQKKKSRFSSPPFPSQSARCPIVFHFVFGVKSVYCVYSWHRSESEFKSYMYRNKSCMMLFTAQLHDFSKKQEAVLMLQKMYMYFCKFTNLNPHYPGMICPIFISLVIYEK